MIRVKVPVRGEDRLSRLAVFGRGGARGGYPEKAKARRRSKEIGRSRKRDCNSVEFVLTLRHGDLLLPVLGPRLFRRA